MGAINEFVGFAPLRWPIWWKDIFFLTFPCIFERRFENDWGLLQAGQWGFKQGITVLRHHGDVSQRSILPEIIRPSLYNWYAKFVWEICMQFCENLYAVLCGILYAILYVIVWNFYMVLSNRISGRWRLVTQRIALPLATVRRNSRKRPSMAVLSYI